MDPKEIEITPAMLAAGVEEFCKGDEVLETKEEIVEKIFRAMIRTMVPAYGNPAAPKGP